MNYRHIFHAGGFADVFKHLVLINLIECIQQKEKPFCYLETHAGRGIYHLGSDASKKTEEASLGIKKLMGSTDTHMPSFIRKYLEIVKKAGYPGYYPGSPFIAETLLRENDRMILTELHHEECKILKKLFKDDQRIAVHHQEGALSLKAFLPPKERRGLTLIDSSFEKPDEWNRIINDLASAIKKFPSGIFAIWYPLKDPQMVHHFLENIFSMRLPDVLVAELSVYSQDASLSLMGSGMLIVNSPFQLANQIHNWLAWTWKNLSINGAGYHRIKSF